MPIVGPRALPKEECKNYVKRIYEPFTDEELSAKIAEMLKPADMNAEAKLSIREDLHASCPDNKGDGILQYFPTHEEIKL